MSLAAAVLAVAKLVGILHVRLIHVFGAGAQVWRGAVVFGLGAAAFLFLLWQLSGDDRRVRLRIVTLLAAHLFAAIGLSAVSVYARITGGPISAAFATFVEESGEALTAAGLLVAVLTGVLPRIPLPAGTPFRGRDENLPADLEAAARVAA